MKMLLLLELDANLEVDAQAQLDAFREAVLPNDYGLSISRATQADLRESGALDQVTRIGPVREAFIKPWDSDEENAEEGP
jgi:hypothetical protein